MLGSSREFCSLRLEAKDLFRKPRFEAGFTEASNDSNAARRKTRPLY